MRTLFLLAGLLSLPSLTLSAQEFSGGFRAGLNFITIDGSAEMSASGDETYETYNNTTGFHVGATFALAFTDLFGLKADLMYSQKGYETVFEGPGYFYLYDNADDRQGTFIFGDRQSELDVVNSYLDVPLTAYYRLGPVELEGGLSVGLMVNSRVSGGITYQTPVYPQIDNIVINVDGNFNSDQAGGGGVIAQSATPVPGTQRNFPEVVSAYYLSDNNERLYQRLDFGAVAGVSFYLNNGLFVGVRYQHGLSDITRGENDLRFAATDGSTDRQFNTDDEDRYRTVQASVGFRF